MKKEMLIAALCERRAAAAATSRNRRPYCRLRYRTTLLRSGSSDLYSQQCHNNGLDVQMLLIGCGFLSNGEGLPFSVPVHRLTFMHGPLLISPPV